VKYFLLFTLILSLTLFLGCETPEELNDEELNLMARTQEPLTVDGSPSGYPAAPVQIAVADIHLAHDSNYLYVHMEGEIQGWVAVGFNTSGGEMDGANMILGYLDGDDPAFRDDVGWGLNHSEANVTALEDFYLSYQEGTAVMEFSYPLSFPEEENYNIKELTPGMTYSLIVAYHDSSSDINQRHTDVGSIDFTVEP